MRKKTWIRAGVTMAAALFLLLRIPGAKAVRERILTAGCPGQCGETVVSMTKGDKMVLSLPGAWDASRVTLEMAGVEELYLGRDPVPFAPGVPGDLREKIGGTYQLGDGRGKTMGYVTIQQGSVLPALFLTVNGDELKAVNRSKENRISAGHALYMEGDGSVTYDGEITQLKGRGNNTFRYQKKPYQIKLAQKADLSGMGEGKTWVLLANWCDISLMRNQIVLDLSREAGLAYAVDCRQTDVWINGSYNGLYLMTEKIQAGKNRIPVTNLEKAAAAVAGQAAAPGKMKKESTAELPLMRYYPDMKDPEDITGGYIATIEKYARLRDYKLAGFRTPGGLSIQIKEPTEPSRAQTEYLGRLITGMQDALTAKDGRNPATGKSWEEYLDAESFAIRSLTEEWTKNYDLLGGSQFIWKDSDRIDPLIHAGPAWDYDLSFGNMRDRGYHPEGNYISQYRKGSNIYWLLEQRESFRETEIRLWREVFRPALAVLLGEKEGGEGHILRSLDDYRAEIEASAQMNFARWGVNSAASGPYSGESFDHAFRYLKDWIRRRTEWMDGAFGTAP